MIPTVEIVLGNLAGFVQEFELSDAEIAMFLEMIENGQEDEAVDIFMEEYIGRPGRIYQELTARYLGKSEDGILSPEDQDNVVRSVALASIAVATLLISNFEKFVQSAYSLIVFGRHGLTDIQLKAAIVREVISQYDGLVRGAMSQTQSFVISGIRSFQRELVAENARLRLLGLTGTRADVEILRFRQGLRLKYKDLYNAIENGNVLVSRKFGSDGESTRHYKLDYYADMATRTTIMNVDRTVVAITAIVNGERVVEFYLADPRIVSKDREICQDILATSINGLSVLALDDEAAAILGIMTVDEAQSTPDYSMSVNCRHSIKRCSREYLDEIDNLIGISK